KISRDVLVVVLASGAANSIVEDEPAVEQAGHADRGKPDRTASHVRQYRASAQHVFKHMETYDQQQVEINHRPRNDGGRVNHDRNDDDAEPDSVAPAAPGPARQQEKQKERRAEMGQYVAESARN